VANNRRPSTGMPQLQPTPIRQPTDYTTGDFPPRRIQCKRRLQHLPAILLGGI